MNLTLPESLRRSNLRAKSYLAKGNMERYNALMGQASKLEARIASLKPKRKPRAKTVKAKTETATAPKVRKPRAKKTDAV